MLLHHSRPRICRFIVLHLEIGLYDDNDRLSSNVNAAVLHDDKYNCAILDFHPLGSYQIIHNCIL